MSANARENAGAILVLMTVVFTFLKVSGFIAWSWWWVLSPVLIPVIAISVLVLFIFIAAAIGEV